MNLACADALGFLYDDMSEVDAELNRVESSAIDLKSALSIDRREVEQPHLVGFLQKPSPGCSQLALEDLVTPSRTWYVKAYDSTVNKNGQIEYLQTQVTLHTLPNRADTDSDGLNDSEEMNLGSDGFSTDLWKIDTDGDLWSDGYEALTKGTNPLTNDTDGDGARDSSDSNPPRNLLVAVRVNAIHHGADPWCSSDLVGIIRVNDDYTWVICECHRFRRDRRGAVA